MIRIFKKFTQLYCIGLLLICATQLNNIYAQNLLDEANINFAAEDSGELFTETIKIISRSGKIFILTNGNQLLNKGDFISLVLKKKGPVARAVVAKVHNQNAGIKILKVYSLDKWKQLRKGLDIQILKGDDTSLFKKKKEVKTETAEATIDSEEDLFNDKLLGEDGDINDFYKDKRLIKPDNVISVGWAPFAYTDTTTGDSRSASQFNYAWAYQFSDNYWAEGLYGRIGLANFPANGIETLIHNFTARAKYTFKAPFYSYLLPYIGFQTFVVSSPNVETAEEENAVNDLNRAQIVLGVTFLKRIVPGWFVKAELGNDIQSIGVAVEF